MLIEEVILAAIADAVFGYAFEKNFDKLGEWARDKLGLNATKKAFKEAFSEAYGQFEKQYPQWVENYFDASFFQHGGAPVLAQFLLRDPTGCATRHPFG
jgi:hypothetical protein